MVYVDIYVPDLGESFEFRCDENASVYSVCEDIRAVLTGKSGGDKNANKDIDNEPVSGKQFWLCDADKHNILSMDKSLKEENIINGNRMIFL